MLKQYTHFIFDEFQDVNAVQYNIMMEFVNHKCKVMIVGDDAQNIYSWRGSQIELIQFQVNKDIRDLKSFTLSTNYRCSTEIIQFANLVIKKSKNLIQKAMNPVKLMGQNKPHIKKFNSLTVQYLEIINQIVRYIYIQGYKPFEIAVLCNTNMPLKFFEEALEKHNSLHPEKKVFYVSLITEKDHQPIRTAEILKNRISISTIHKSKGLEWKIVFCIGCNDEFFPSLSNKKAPNLIEE